MTLKNSIKLDNFLPVALVILSLAFAAGLFLFAYLGTFSRYGADDYCFSRRLLESDNIIQATIIWYMNTSNRYTTMLLVGISEWFGPSAIQYLPALVILLWLIALTWTLSRLFAKLHFSYPYLSGFTLTTAILFFSILQAPNLYQSLYWRSGMVTYFTPLIAFSFLGGLILTEIWRETPRSKTSWITILAFISVGFFFAGGLSETTLAIQGGALGLSIIAAWFMPRGEQRNKTLILLFTALIASIIALVVLLVAPANALRVRAFGPPPPLMNVLKFSLIFAVDFMRETFRSFPTPTLAILLTAFLLGFGLYKEGMPLSKNKTLTLSLIVIPVLTYLLIAFSMSPSMYGQKSYPGARSLMATRAVMVTGLLAFGLLAGMGLRRCVTPWLATRRLLSTAALSITILSISLSSVYPLYAADKVSDLIPWYSNRAIQWDSRDAEIRRAVAEGVTDLDVVQLDTIGGVQEYKHKKNNWVNRCAAAYYGLDSISALVP